MTFREDLARQVLAGTKTVTRRAANTNPRSPYYQGKCGLRAGQSIAVQPGRGKPAIGRAEVLAVWLEPLGHLTDDAARAEGFKDRRDFEAGWASINGTYDPTVHVWRISLRAEA